MYIRGQMSNTIKFEWDCAGSKWITLVLDGKGAGELSSNLKAKCPYCDDTNCYGDCKTSQWHLMDPETQALHPDDKPDFPESLEPLDEMEARRRYNTLIDGMEALLLELAIRAVDVIENNKAAFTDALLQVVEEYSIISLLNEG